MKKILILSRRRLTVLAGLLGALAIISAVNSPLILPTAGSSRQLPIYCVQQQEKRCALSFDAAWGNEDTQQLIDILARYNIKTTFFLVGEWAEKYPESVKALAAAGHEIMNHSDRHGHYNAMSREEIQADLSACNEKITALTGVTPSLMRCPYGEYDDHVIRAVRDMGMEPIQWDVDSLDWKELSAAEITRRVTQRVQPGSIVLFHNAAANTPQALPQILEELIRRGYCVVPVSQLLLPGSYNRDFSIDHTGRQCPLPGAA